MARTLAHCPIDWCASRKIRGFTLTMTWYIPKEVLWDTLMSKA